MTFSRHWVTSSLRRLALLRPVLRSVSCRETTGCISFHETGRPATLPTSRLPRILSSLECQVILGWVRHQASLAPSVRNSQGSPPGSEVW